ncbi:hypothetical protein PIB30_053186 [Stylosanthes scabra]|uniref:Uncharacterized protein n=1 Tax=Stylosanthes scabra TaxID=79078 RepID=A0ABU6XG58_9FABA|nr:hypothetical protein [Stylosanthes scabra]
MPQPRHRCDPGSSDTGSWTASLNQLKGTTRTQRPRSPRDPKLLCDTPSPPSSSTPKETASSHRQPRRGEYKETPRRHQRDASPAKPGKTGNHSQAGEHEADKCIGRCAKMDGTQNEDRRVQRCGESPNH